MIFTEVRFLLFFALTFSVYWALRGNGLRKAWLLVLSYAFYGAWDWRFLFLMAGSTVLDYGVGLALSRTERTGWRRFWLTCSLVGNLGALGVFKYYDFFVSEGAALLAWLGLPVEPHLLHLVLPAGISFYTFQTLSYAIDVYRRQLAPVRRFSDFALFVAFFPQLVAGPIVRAADFLPQLDHKRTWADVRVRACLGLFLIGYVKKACISDNIAASVDTIFADPHAYGTADLWLGSVLFMVRIYCDFSGYSDMAIATAGLLGYELLLNFDYPFIARSMTEFWRRWHMSLGNWLRDYLYQPLGGRRGGRAKMTRNLAIVYLVAGVWHGANWTFLCWGLYFGVFVYFEGLLRFPDAQRVPGPLRNLYMLFVLVVGCTLFPSHSIGAAWDYIAGMFGVLQAAPTATLDRALWGVVALFAAGHVLAYRRTFVPLLERLPDWAFALGLGAAVALVLPFVAPDYAAFIYFQF